MAVCARVHAAELAKPLASAVRVAGVNDEPAVSSGLEVELTGRYSNRLAALRELLSAASVVSPRVP
jgi:hypothetical protein